MKSRNNHFMDAIYVVFLAFCLVILGSCAHDPALEKKINAETQQQPAMNAYGRAVESEKAIQAAPLSEKQKARLDEIRKSTIADLKLINDEESKLRLLLVKQLVNPASDDREIDAIKQKILELNQKGNKRWLSALDDARQAIGRRNEQDAKFYRAFLQDPMPPEDAGRGFGK